MAIFIIGRKFWFWWKDIWEEFSKLKDVLKEFLGGEKFIKNDLLIIVFKLSIVELNNIKTTKIKQQKLI